MPTPVYPTFPENPDLGDTFTPLGTDQVWTYTSFGWAKTVIELQDRDTEYPIWGGRIIDIARGGGGGGGGGGG